MFSAILIDGYNLLHVLGFIRGKVTAKGLEAARLRLLDYLAPLLGAHAGRTTIVFDASGKIERLVPQGPYQQIGVQYSGKGVEADDVIEAQIARHPQPAKLAVVSSDRRLKEAARRRGARGFSCTAFLDWLEEQADAPARKKAAAQEEPADEKPTGPGEKTRWLQEFAGLQDDPELKEAFDDFDIPDEPEAAV